MNAAVDTLEKISEDPDVQRQARDLEDARLMFRHAMLTTAKKNRAEGKAEAQRDAIRLICRMLGLELGAPQEDHLASLDANGLASLLSHLEQHRSLPDGF